MCHKNAPIMGDSHTHTDGYSQLSVSQWNWSHHKRNPIEEQKLKNQNEN